LEPKAKVFLVPHRRNLGDLDGLRLHFDAFDSFLTPREHASTFALFISHVLHTNVEKLGGRPPMGLEEFITKNRAAFV
jgi:hypothetical protein